MSAFEHAAFAWYFENVNAFAIETGMVAELIKAESLKHRPLAFFLSAQDRIRETFRGINDDYARKIIADRGGA